METSKIKSGLMVHAKGPGKMGGAPGEHVGTVDHLEGTKYIKLRRTDSTDQKHHWVPISLVSHVDDKAVYLNCTKDEFSKQVLNSLPTEVEEEPTVRTISQEALREKMTRGENIQIVNVLEPKHYNLGFIKGSLKIPVSQIETRAKELDRSKEIITYCASYQCKASREAVEKLSKMGFNAAAYLGGLEEWKKSGFPIELEQKAA